MSIYVEGLCMECGNRIAAAVKHDEDSWREDILEFVENGYRVNVFVTDERVEVEAHEPNCSREPRKIKEIRPELPGELWKKRYSVNFTSYFHTEYDWGASIVGRKPPLFLISGTTTAVVSEAEHGKNGWERIWPDVKED